MNATVEMKPEFRSTLDTRELDDNRSVLLAPLIFYSKRLGREIAVPTGFVTDYASVPRLPVAYLAAGGCAKEASVVHDWLYRTKPCPRADADAVFDEAMAVTGQWWWRRKLMWAGVRIFGWVPYANEEPYNADDPDLKGETK